MPTTASIIDIMNQYRGAAYLGKQGRYDEMLASEAAIERQVEDLARREGLDPYRASDLQGFIMARMPGVAGRYVLRAISEAISEIERYERDFTERRSRERAELERQRIEREKQAEAERVAIQTARIEEDLRRGRQEREAELARRLAEIERKRQDEDDEGECSCCYDFEHPEDKEETSNELFKRAIAAHCREHGLDPSDIIGVNATWDRASVSGKLEFFFDPGGMAKKLGLMIANNGDGRFQLG